MHRFPSFIVFAFALLFGAPAIHAVTEIPITLQDGMVCLKVEAQGKTLNFLLDSGAGRSVVDSATAKKLGLKEGAHQMVQGADGCCTAYRVEDFNGSVTGVPVPRSILALDLGPISKTTGSHIDGLLGLDFFRGRVLQIDYRARKVRLFDRGETAPGNGQALSLARRNDALCLRVSVDGNSAEWMQPSKSSSPILPAQKLRPRFASGPTLKKLPPHPPEISSKSQDRLNSQRYLGLA